MNNLDNIRKMNSEELAEILDASVVKCKNCTYKDDYSCKRENCISEIKKWLEQEVTPTLTDDEKVILRNIDEEYTCIFRDSNGYLKVRDDNGEWIGIYVYEHLFKFIKENEYYEISDLLGE